MLTPSLNTERPSSTDDFQQHGGERPPRKQARESVSSKMEPIQPINQIGALVYGEPIWAYTQGRIGHKPKRVWGLLA